MTSTQLNKTSHIQTHTLTPTDETAPVKGVEVRKFLIMVSEVAGRSRGTMCPESITAEGRKSRRK